MLYDTRVYSVSDMDADPSYARRHWVIWKKNNFKSGTINIIHIHVHTLYRYYTDIHCVKPVKLIIKHQTWWCAFILYDYCYMYVQYVHVILNVCIRRNMQPYLNSICDNQRHRFFFLILDDHYNMHDIYIYVIYTFLLACQHSYVIYVAFDMVIYCMSINYIITNSLHFGDRNMSV